MGCDPTFDWSPLDLLSDIFLLFRLEGELDEDLLELFVDVIDAQLLKAIVVKDLKAAGMSAHGESGHSLDIEDSNDIVGVRLRLHGHVDTADDPLEEVVVSRCQLSHSILSYNALVKASRPEDA